MSESRFDWRTIRILNGSQASAFEELCAQLARAEIGGKACFERKGTPDAGVECYAVFGDGSEWGWQAKYFDSLGDTQWSQLDESVATALEKHPRLTRYFVCVPLDRADARISRKKSAMDKWNAHAARWRGRASAKGSSVEFTYWGRSELLEQLSRPEHLGRRRFWFDLQALDSTWFATQLDAALSTAGPRYTPELHIDLPIARNFEGFGRTERFVDGLKAIAREIREKSQDVEASGRASVEEVKRPLAVLTLSVEALLRALGEIRITPSGDSSLASTAEEIGRLAGEAQSLSQLL